MSECGTSGESFDDTDDDEDETHFEHRNDEECKKGEEEEKHTELFINEVGSTIALIQLAVGGRVGCREPGAGNSCPLALVPCSPVAPWNCLEESSRSKTRQWWEPRLAVIIGDQVPLRCPRGWRPGVSRAGVWGFSVRGRGLRHFQPAKHQALSSSIRASFSFFVMRGGRSKFSGQRCAMLIKLKGVNPEPHISPLYLAAGLRVQ